MTQSAYQIQAVVFDWAGTTIDYGSRAPAIVFQQVFRERGIKITVDQARRCYLGCQSAKAKVIANLYWPNPAL